MPQLPCEKFKYPRLSCFEEARASHVERLPGERGRNGTGEREGGRRGGGLASTSSSSHLSPAVIVDIPAPLDTVWRGTKKTNQQPKSRPQRKSRVGSSLSLQPSVVPYLRPQTLWSRGNLSLLCTALIPDPQNCDHGERVVI